MANLPHNARVTGPVPYTTTGGRRKEIPIGPCLVEQVAPRVVDIIWGSRGQSSAAISIEEVKAAEEQGHLLVLD